jgi:uncharacterized repeat protein (TIGR01451 family)
MAPYGSAGSRASTLLFFLLTAASPLAAAQRGLPFVPPNCAGLITDAANTTPTPIPDVATATSTVTLAGANPFLFQVLVRTNITHTFAADLDITLTSPEGTVVTMSTDNGAGNDNVFNGTLWSDDAVPATDFVYTNLVPAPFLIPEEALGAFYGENPNGTWTLTVVDDLAGDTGSIDSWSLSVTALATAPTEGTTVLINPNPVGIPDVATVTSSVTGAGVGAFLCRATLTTNIEHTFAANLDITLTAPTSETQTITTDNGAGNDNVFDGTLWTDDGGTPASDAVYANLVLESPLVPEGAMSGFQGVDPNGTWTLTITNDLAGDVGILDGWQLALTTCECAAPDADLTLAKSVDPPTVAPGGNAVFTLTVSNAGPGDATNAVVTDTLPAGLTYVSNDCGANFATPDVTWNVGTLTVGASAVCNLTVTVDEAGTFVNNAVATSDGPDPIPADNNATATVGGQQAVQEIPTLNTLGLLALLMGLGLAGLWILRRRA